MKVLSLFNGMSTGHQALVNLGIKVDTYYSSEIKPYAIKLTQHHFPETIQLGDVTKWKEWDIDWNIDLLLSGSPCQDLSIAGKRAGINGSRSGLFWVFIDILEHIKKKNPKVKFLQENVGSAPKLDVGIMSRALGVYPVRINSKLVTAQLRDRYYWSNIRTKETMFDIVTDIPQPKDRKIMFKDIITDGNVERKKAYCMNQRDYKDFIKSPESENKMFQKIFKKGKESLHANTVYVESDKHTCLNTGSGNSGSQKYLKHRNETIGMISLIHEDTKVRTVNKIEMCRLQGFPDDYCDILTKAHAGSLLGDGWTLPIIEHILSFIKI